VTLQLSPIRRRFLEFLVAVAIVHVAAIIIYYATDLQHAAPNRQRVFAWVWMGATVLVVFVGLQRIKRARYAARFGATTSVEGPKRQ
jgi:hypothetical protein